MAQRIKRPEFSWWPYRTVALLVPMLAMGAAAGAGLASNKTSSARDLEVTTVFFAVLGAGNAYLFAIAIGDLGKTVLAVPAGGFAGFLAVNIFGHPPATIVYLILLGLLTVQAMMSGVYRAVAGCGGLFLMLMAGIVVGNLHSDFEPIASAVCSYPFICGAVAACMPYERTFSGIRSAWLAGTLNATYGMIVSCGWMTLLSFVGGIAAATLGSRGSVVGGVIMVGSAVIGLCVANFYCAKSLFFSVYRVSDEPDLPPRVAPVVETPAPVVALPVIAAPVAETPAVEPPAVADVQPQEPPKPDAL